MVLSEIVKTCSHDKVAHAAIASLGPAFLDRVRSAADRHGLQPGSFVAESVRRFQAGAGEREKCELQRAVHGADMPVLRGLAMIVEHDLGDRFERG
jgi:hypothetical protein